MTNQVGRGYGVSPEVLNEMYICACFILHKILYLFYNKVHKVRCNLYIGTGEDVECVNNIYGIYLN